MRNSTLLLTGILAAIASHSQAATFYSLTDLGELNISPTSQDYQSLKIKINDNNQVVGWERISKSSTSNFSGFIWSAGTGKSQPIASSYGYQFFNNNLNAQTVGYTYDVNQQATAYRWNSDFTQQDTLQNLGGNWSVAYGINDSNQAVGSSKDSSGILQAVIWNGSSVTSISNSTIGNNQATSVNNSGAVTGQIVSGDVYQAFRWDGSLTTLNQIDVTISSSWGSDINESGQIVGGFNSTSSSNTYPGFNFSNNAFLWDPINGFTDLGISKDYITWGTAINNEGLIVGGGLINNTTNFNDTRKALLWENNTAYELNTLLTGNNIADWKLQDATDINNNGLIVGIGKLNNVYHAFLLTPEAAILASADLSLNAMILNTPMGKPSTRAITIDTNQQFALLVKNNGPDEANNITLSLDSDLVSVIENITPDKGNCQIDNVNNTATCTIDTLAKDEQVSLQFQLNNSSDQSFDVEASVTADEIDPQTSINNVFKETVSLKAAQVIIEPKADEDPKDGTPDNAGNIGGGTSTSTKQKSGGGSGCTLGNGSSAVDPILPLLTILVMMQLIRRYCRP